MYELNNIYNEDCLVGMSKIPDKSIDLVLTDPPYLMNYKSNRRVKSEKFDYIMNDINSEELIKEYIKECHRILKGDTSIYMFCSWHQVDFFKKEFEKYFKLKNLLVWNKNNHGSGDLKGAYAPKHELILYGHKGRSLFREKRIPDVIDYSKVPSNKLVHPTEKPIGLLETFIKNSSDEINIVFDGFMGSATTAIAALNTNRRFIGFELDKEYYEIANKRIQEYMVTV
jgi:site-specific DNA-methyltransferase (adenine-specific)